MKPEIEIKTEELVTVNIKCNRHQLENFSVFMQFAIAKARRENDKHCGIPMRGWEEALTLFKELKHMWLEVA